MSRPAHRPGRTYKQVDRTGRRKPWLLSATACSLTLLYIGIYVTISQDRGTGSAPMHAAGTGATAMIMLYGICKLASVKCGVPLTSSLEFRRQRSSVRLSRRPQVQADVHRWIVAAEIYPIRIRSITGAFAASLQWLFSASRLAISRALADRQFILTLAFPYMIASPMGPNGVFFFFSVLCAATA